MSEEKSYEFCKKNVERLINNLIFFQKNNHFKKNPYHIIS